jgi:hypothetical protein
MAKVILVAVLFVACLASVVHCAYFGSSLYGRSADNDSKKDEDDSKKKFEGRSADYSGSGGSSQFGSGSPQYGSPSQFGSGSSQYGAPSQSGSGSSQYGRSVDDNDSKKDKDDSKKKFDGRAADYGGGSYQYGRSVDDDSKKDQDDNKKTFEGRAADYGSYSSQYGRSVNDDNNSKKDEDDNKKKFEGRGADYGSSYSSYGRKRRAIPSFPAQPEQPTAQQQAFARGPKQFSVNVADGIQGASQLRKEKWDNGTVTGVYANPLGNKKFQLIHYMADDKGYRVVKTEVVDEAQLHAKKLDSNNKQAHVDIDQDGTQTQYTVTPDQIAKSKPEGRSVKDNDDNDSDSGESGEKKSKSG